MDKHHIVYNDDPNTLPEICRETYIELIQDYNCNKPVGTELRKEIISSLEMKNETDYFTSSTGLVKYMYNCIPFLICIILLGMGAVFTHRWPYALIVLGIIMRAMIMTALSPQPLYMYYFSTELICSVLLMFLLAFLLCRKTEINRNSNINQLD